VRRVAGKATEELTAADFAALRGTYDRVLLDVGTGDGKHVLTVARDRPDTLVVGLDAAPDGMRRAAARAAARPDRGGLPNALFVWASAERLPEPLAGLDELHVLMPWGSLLRGLLDGSPLRRDLAAAARPGGEFLVTLNLHAWRPPVPEVGDLPEPTPGGTDLPERFARDGWDVTGAGYLDADQVAALATSWTRRLRSSRDELAVLGLTGRYA
jgi:16S rRNA (adenine(1408)-N(1))-methyltransferase